MSVRRSAHWSNKDVDKIDIVEIMKNNQFNDIEISTGIEILKFIELKKEIGASNRELLVHTTKVKAYNLFVLNLFLFLG